MKNKKVYSIIVIVILIIVFLTAGIILFLNYSSNVNNLTVIEKKWITDNVNTVVDVAVYNDVPVYGYNGEGIIFDFLDYFASENQIKFNKISYYSNSQVKDTDVFFKVLGTNEVITNNDILLYQDHYVILAKEDVGKLDFNNAFKLGALESDKEVLRNYFNDSIAIEVYEDTDKLVNGLENEEIDYLILPNLGQMNFILSNKLNIVYHVEDLKKNFVLSVKDSTVYNILKKSYNKYLSSNYEDDYVKNYLNMYFRSTSTSDLEQKNYNAKTYHYGYVVNMPYENYVNNGFVGTILNYLSEFEKQTGVEIEATLYPTIDDLKSALVEGEIDFVLGNFNYQNINLDKVITTSINDLDYVVLSKDNYSINSLKGFVNEEVSVVAASLLYQELINNNVKAKMYSNTDELLRSLDDYSIVLMDKEAYLYYKDTKLKDYNIIFEGTVDGGYRFILNSKNEPFNSLFSYFVSTIDYQTIRYDYNTNITLDKDYTTLQIFIFMIVLLLILALTIIYLSRKSVVDTIISKDEKLKYIDAMTSLKNRNYLNVNIYKWDDNVIFPQAIITLDINGLRDINDKYGREVGDEIINKVASILINNQLENTDIVRSGGDEFLIYMVGYDEKKVSAYAKKLIKDMKDIPNSCGVEMGYSMILDEVKTIDDAINEAITMMVKTKEKKNSKEKE